MSDISADLWPKFELLTYTPPTGVSNGWDAELLRTGVPKGLFGRYRANNTLELLEVPHYGPVVSFGASMLFGRVCLDPRTGAVVDISVMPAHSSNSGVEVISPPGFVNSSLEQFIASVQAVFNRFPFDSGGTPTEQEWNDRKDAWAKVDRLESEWDQTVEDLTKALGKIDAAAVADADSFWRTFLDDVQMGDFSTEDVLRGGSE